MNTQLKTLAALLLLSTLNPQLPTFAQGTAFTYQGRLNDGANPANGAYDLRFTIYDALTSGAQQGNVLTNSATAVSNGLFTVTLDFGNQFPGADRWLEIGVRTNGGGAFTNLSPRLHITATPYAITAGTVTGVVPTAGLSGTYGGAVTFNNAGNSFSGNGGGLTNLDAGNLSGGAVPPAALGNAWKTAGNAGTSPGVNFIGTTDNQPLELRAGNSRALRLEPNAGGGAPNVIGGAPVNFVASGIFGATIAGGGSRGASTNSVLGAYGTVGGGANNTASADSATVAGGLMNLASGNASTASGGGNNTASGPSTTIGGGSLNVASGDSATVGGGTDNTASGVQATVGGGVSNTATNTYATVGGGIGNTASGYAAIVSGGYGNTASDQSATVSGGEGNMSSAKSATVGGGEGNTAGGIDATVSGGLGNTATYNYATVGGGYQNTARLDAATVGGGYGNSATNSFATIGGGYGNVANGNYATVGGGFNNTASNFCAIVGGGYANSVGANFATVPGGSLNLAAGQYSFAAGYQANANHTGAFVWADSQTAVFGSTAINQFSVRANGGVRFVTGGAGMTLDGQIVVTTNAALRSGGNAFTGQQTITGGRLGIGTVSPQRTLQVGDSAVASSEGMIHLGSRSASGASLRDWELGVPQTGETVTGEGYSFVIRDTTASATARFMVQWGTGNVGIGSSSPQTALHVRAPDAGQLRLENSANGRYFNLYTESTGNLLFLPGSGVYGYLRYTDGAWLSGSDERLKRDITPLNGVLGRVLQLHPVSYHFRNSAADTPRSLGFIAQEVEPLFPEVVGEHSGMKALAYSELVPVTIRAVQELNQKLEQKLEQKEAEITELKTRLETLEQLMNPHDGRAR